MGMTPRLPVSVYYKIAVPFQDLKLSLNHTRVDLVPPH